VLGADDAVASQDQRVLDRVSQLPHVAMPRALRQLVERRAREAHAGLFLIRTFAASSARAPRSELPDEVIDQERDVVRPLSLALHHSTTRLESAAPGVSSGDALNEMEKLAERSLPQGMGYAWSGISLEETKAGRQSFLIFGLALLLVYLTLAAQYESLVLPFIVLLGVPLAVLGALTAQWARGLANDVYCQVGLVMLIGLAAKNAILIVEFAEQLRVKGLSVIDAAVQAARIRLRPILMTSLAFILGVLPLAFATGAGQEARHSVGTAVAGGMLVSTFLNVVFIPILYVVVQTMRGAVVGARNS
jgi:Cu/Ag efflux pump CusA